MTKFLYLRKNNGTVTIAYNLEKPDPETIRFEWSAAFCNPKDHFNKKLGRSIAVGRMNRNKLVMTEIQDNKDKGLHSQVIETLKTMFVDGSVSDVFESQVTKMPNWWRN